MRTLKILVLAALLAPASALANGDGAPYVNPRDLGMAESLVAAQNSSGAAYWNPAALAGIQGLDISAAGSLLLQYNTWTATTPEFAAQSPKSMQRKPVPPPTLFAAYGGKIGDRDFGIGAGMSLVAGGNVFWDDDWAGRYNIITVDRKVFGIYLSGGLEIVKQLKLGGGLVYYRTTEHLRQAAGNVIPAVVGEVGTAGGAATFDVSAEITPVLGFPLTIGVDYKHKAHQKLTGDAHFSNVPAALQSQPRLQDQGVTHFLVIPNRLNLGLAFRPVEKLLLTLAWTFDRYIVYADDTFIGDKGVTLVVPRNYSNGATYRIGGEYQATPQLQIRAGVFRDVSGLPRSPDGSSPTYSPSLPDGNSWDGAVGASWAFSKAFAIHGAFFYSVFDKIKSDPSQGAFPGQYDISAWVATLGFTYRWDPSQRVAQLSQP
jgi:long-chain fatty acid transport protein